jgi:uncharacterized protein YwgA
MSEQKSNKHLKAKAYDYDFLNDSIFFYKEGEKYRSSLEFNGIILDFSEDDNLMNLEMLDVSEKFHISKSDILNLKKFNAIIDIDEENIKVTMEMKILKRNKLFDKCLEALTLNILNLPSSTQEIAVTC